MGFILSNVQSNKVETDDLIWPSQSANVSIGSNIIDRLTDLEFFS